MMRFLLLFSLLGHAADVRILYWIRKLGHDPCKYDFTKLSLPAFNPSIIKQRYERLQKKAILQDPEVESLRLVNVEDWSKAPDGSRHGCTTPTDRAYDHDAELDEIAVVVARLHPDHASP